MSGIFSKNVFPEYTSAKLMKPQMNGFNDPTLKDFSLLNTATLFQDDFKEEKFETEFIQSFLNAAKAVAETGRKNIDQPEMYVLKSYSYAIPALFLTRHCMELSIKRAIRKCHRHPKTNHDLRGLWSSFLQWMPEQRRIEDHRSLENMGLFVTDVAEIDNNGISLRYPTYKTGKRTKDKTLFVNNEEVVAYLEKFVEQLELLEFEDISSHRFN